MQQLSHVSLKVGAERVEPVSRSYNPVALRRLMQGGSKTFFAASLMLPTRVRAPATALYAYCRLADDAIDLGSDPHQAMQGLRSRLDAIYAGRPGEADADRALCQVVHRFAIPREPLDGLLEGFLWDAQGRHYETLADVQDYGARVAGTVGVMMALVMGTRSATALARAAELGVAMQLTNIARDVGEDARNGRLYLPRQWLATEALMPSNPQLMAMELVTCPAPMPVPPAISTRQESTTVDRPNGSFKKIPSPRHPLTVILLM